MKSESRGTALHRASAGRGRRWGAYPQSAGSGACFIPMKT